MLEFEPPQVGFVFLWLLQASNECVINIPTVEIAEKVVACGNSSGATTDKFAKFRFMPIPATPTDIFLTILAKYDIIAIHKHASSRQANFRDLIPSQTSPSTN